MSKNRMEYAARITALMDRGCIAEAIASISAHIRQHPQDDRLHYLMGNAYRRLGDWQHALESYAEAIELNPCSPALKAKEMAENILNYRCKELLNP